MDHASVLTDYRSLRATGKALASKLIKMLSREDLHTAADRLGMLHNNTLVFKSEEEMAVLMDYAIHEIFHDRQNAVERMLRDDPPPEGSEEMRVLLSLRSAHYTMILIREGIPGFGALADDLLLETPVEIVDQGLSQCAAPGAAAAIRLCSPGEGWWMSTGAALPLTTEARDRIYSAVDEYRRRHGKEPRGTDFSTLIIRECLAAGASESIRYADAGTSLASVQPSSALAREKIGRNDSCPCGSGKKYKKCCGA